MKQKPGPISFDVNVARLPKKGMPVLIEATPAQRAELAKIHDLVSVDTFRAELNVSAWKRNGISIEGRVVANVVQADVASLEPMEAIVDEPVSAIFLPETSKLGRESFGQGGEIMVDFDGPDSPETFSGDIIDVGALAEEFFGLGIDPYPRKAGSKLASTPDVEAQEEGILQRKLRKLFPDS